MNSAVLLLILAGGGYLIYYLSQHPSLGLSVGGTGTGSGSGTGTGSGGSIPPNSLAAIYNRILASVGGPSQVGGLTVHTPREWNLIFQAASGIVPPDPTVIYGYDPGDEPIPISWWWPVMDAYMRTQGMSGLSGWRT